MDRVNTAIARAFDEAGIEIPYPQRDIHIRTPPG
jgi:small-conductance mechanosensitive channel